MAESNIPRATENDELKLRELSPSPSPTPGSQEEKSPRQIDEDILYHEDAVRIFNGFASNKRSKKGVSLKKGCRIYAEAWSLEARNDLILPGRIVRHFKKALPSKKDRMGRKSLPITGRQRASSTKRSRKKNVSAGAEVPSSVKTDVPVPILEQSDDDVRKTPRQRQIDRVDRERQFREAVQGADNDDDESQDKPPSLFDFRLNHSDTDLLELESMGPSGRVPNVWSPEGRLGDLTALKPDASLPDDFSFPAGTAPISIDLASSVDDKRDSISVVALEGDIADREVSVSMSVSELLRDDDVVG